MSDLDMILEVEEIAGEACHQIKFLINWQYCNWQYCKWRN
jgi:hypothetical protein